MVTIRAEKIIRVAAIEQIVSMIKFVLTCVLGASVVPWVVGVDLVEVVVDVDCSLQFIHLEQRYLISKILRQSLLKWYQYIKVVLCNKVVFCVLKWLLPYIVITTTLIRVLKWFL